MTSKKIAIDTSSKYIPMSEQIKERDIKPNTIRTDSNLRRQKK